MRDEWLEIIEEVRGKPFQWGARGPGAFDCWGLVLHVLYRLGKTGMPDWEPPVEVEGVARVLQRQQKLAQDAAHLPPGWIKVDTPAPGDIVAMGTTPLATHAGVWTPFGVLHVSEGMGVIVSSLRYLQTVRLQVHGYYRWEG